MEQTSIYLQGRKLVPSRVAKRVNEKSPASSNVINARYRAANGDALLKSLYIYCVYLKTGRTNKIPPENFPYFCGDFFTQNRKKAAKLPEWRSLTDCFVWKSLPKPPDSGGDSNGKSLRSAGSKTSYFDDIAIKIWPTVKSANQYGGDEGDRTPYLLNAIHSIPGYDGKR